jgi:nucleoside-diphosphate-sugar epimerase
MNILITGNTGYIGPVLIRHLRQTLPRHRYAGFDSGYFAHVLTGASQLPEIRFDAQYWGDLREFPYDLLDSVDVIVHLAAISNDPMGNRFGPVTEAINDKASRALAAEAKQRGVRSFILASSCSMYGYAEGAPRNESSTLNPLTAYARSKVSMENALQRLAGDDFVVTSLRFATACGMSDRLRLDLVLNDFVACAMTTGEITILSDGTPWRPLIDVTDMSLAIEWAIGRQAEVSGPAFIAANIGKSNYQVIDLARAVADAIPGTRISVNPDAAPDKRSYQVDFSLFQSIAPDHQPQTSLRQSIEELKSGMERMKFADSEFRSSDYMRLKVLERHVQDQRLTDDLRWTGKR